jgi:hypothetical protein
LGPQQRPANLTDRQTVKLKELQNLGSRETPVLIFSAASEASSRHLEQFVAAPRRLPGGFEPLQGERHPPAGFLLPDPRTEEVGDGLSDEPVRRLRAVGTPGDRPPGRFHTCGIIGRSLEGFERLEFLSGVRISSLIQVLGP